MKRALALLLAIAPVAFADDDVAKALQNLTVIHSMAAVMEIRHASHVAGALNPPNDPWGHPYRVDESDDGYRIIGAGRDGKFDEATWGEETQFDGLDGDVVLAAARVRRSNRNWLYAQDHASPAWDQLRHAEITFAMTLDPIQRNMVAGGLTQVMMENHAPADAWGTPFRTDETEGHVRVVSAGADRTFQPESWGRPAGGDVGEDIVMVDGRIVRRVDTSKTLKDAHASLTMVPQPPDPPFPAELTQSHAKIGGVVKAPAATKRVEPVYPEAYRRLRGSGIVIVQVAIADTGAVEGVHLLKSLAPDFDTAAMDAVRQGKFEPGTSDGKPVPVLFNLTINFKLVK